MRILITAFPLGATIGPLRHKKPLRQHLFTISLIFWGGIEAKGNKAGGSKISIILDSGLALGE